MENEKEGGKEKREGRKERKERAASDRKRWEV